MFCIFQIIVTKTDKPVQQEPLDVGQCKANIVLMSSLKPLIEAAAGIEKHWDFKARLLLETGLYTLKISCL